MTYVRDHARQEWVNMPAAQTIVLQMPKTTKQPIGFIRSESPTTQPKDLRRLAGGWGKQT